jgi:transcriptional regulator with XRE-family HTH domain
MREKLTILMKSEQLTMTKFAELLGIQPSGISHILSGRNNASLDMVKKVLRRFPQINPDWLLLDKDEMYRTERPNQSSELPLGGGENLSAATSSDATSSNISESSTLSSHQPYVPQATQTTTQDVLTSLSANPTRVKRVILLLDDHTFESYEVKR